TAEALRPAQDFTYILEASKPKELNEAEIRAQLETLFGWVGSPAYSFCFVMLPRYINVGEMTKADCDTMVKQGKNWKVHTDGTGGRTPPAAEGRRSGAITVAVLPGFEAIPNRQGLCVVLDGFGTRVPVRAAEALASHFAHGLVTRLVLGEYVKSWHRAGANLD